MRVLVSLALALYALPLYAEVKFGVIVPLSGEAAAVGAACRNSMRIALEKVPPEVQSKIKILYEDDANSPANTLSAFNRLKSFQGAQVFLTMASNTSNALAPVVEGEKLPLIAVASDPNVPKGRNYVVNLWVKPETEAELAVQETLRRGYQKIAIVTVTHSGIQAVRQAFDQANQGRLQVVYKQEYNFDANDFRMALTKIKALPAVDAIFVNLYFAQCGSFARQARELGLSAPLFSIETFEDPNEVKLSRGALEGQWYVQADEPDASFLDRYRKLFPGTSFYGGPNCHDAVLIVAKAVEGGHTSAEEINNFIHSLKDFKGALGTYSYESGGTFSLPATVKMVRGTDFVKVYP
jgi:branched-chain amino acid transport system substrate-binding protein